ncbi:hypothetical protein NLI96_g10277 [Meripilus lineatus]|uniref:DUF6533 domain-containing protein n=1 Tax=Meripilus lineatus TaxID=2056292 RepID=A0AAD5YEH8_9APHY|nr:hypothetical protein NLI96_g10277 [Physisporinus lineatus]
MNDSVTSDLYLYQYAHVFGGVILYYDWLLTLADEIEYFWSGSKSIVVWLVLVTRYFPFFSYPAVMVSVITTSDDHTAILPHGPERTAPHHGCQMDTPGMAGIRIATAWEGLFVFDITIFILTLFKTLKRGNENCPAHIRVGENLFDIYISLTGNLGKSSRPKAISNLTQAP